MSAAADPAFDEINAVFAAAAGQGRRVLLEAEVYAILRRLSLECPAHIVADAAALRSGTAIFPAAGRQALNGGKAVVKLMSSKHLHKTDCGGVVVVPNTLPDLEAAFREMHAKFPGAEGVMGIEFVRHAKGSLGHELVLGARYDDAFGPILSLGPGGTGVEEFSASLRPGLSPSIAAAGDLSDTKGVEVFLDSCWIWRHLSGAVRGKEKLLERGAVSKWLTGLAGLMREFSDFGPRDWTIEEVEVNPLVVSDGRLVAIDGLLRFRPCRRAGAIPRPPESVAALLDPGSVALVGVGNETSMGRIILRNLIHHGFSRNDLFVIKKDIDLIDGVKCRPSIADLPGPVDMLVISTSSSTVPQLMGEIASSGKAIGVVVISAGLGEKSGTESLECDALRIIAAARKAGGKLAVCGGNSLGIISSRSNVNTFFIPTYKLEARPSDSQWRQNVAVISQSGAFIVAAASRLEWLDPLYAVSAGNQIDITISDYAECVAEKPEVSVIVIYVEGFKPGDGLRLAGVIREARKSGKAVILYKAGRTPAGTQAVRGHTASIAGEFAAAREIFSAAGALVAETFDDLDDAVKIASAFHGMNSGSGRTFLATNAGFEAAGMADSIRPGSSFQLLAPGTYLRASLAGVLATHKLNGIIDPANPMDMTPMAGDAAFLDMVNAALASEEVDMMVLSIVPLTPALRTLPPGEGHKEDYRTDSVVSGLGEIFRKQKKPVVFCVSSGSLYDPYARAVEAQGIPVFRAADRAARALSLLSRLS